MDKGFGWYVWQGPGYGFDGLKNKNYLRVKSTNDNRWYIKYGNDFGDAWIDHHTVENFYFLDNPELPHLLYPNPANPNGLKNFVRLVPNGILTNTHTQSGTDRMNQTLSELVGKPTVWQDIANPKDVAWNNSRKVLLCPSSPNCFKYYYNTTQQQWIEHYTRELESRGYSVEVRNKPTRNLRRDPNQRLCNILKQSDYAFTVSQHSVSAIESILAGTVAVVTGPHGCGELATPWQHFVEGSMQTPTVAEQEAWVDTLLGNTWTKQDIRTGAWYDS